MIRPQKSPSWQGPQQGYFAPHAAPPRSDAVLSRSPMDAPVSCLSPGYISSKSKTNWIPKNVLFFEFQSTFLTLSGGMVIASQDRYSYTPQTGSGTHQGDNTHPARQPWLFINYSLLISKCGHCPDPGEARAHLCLWD